MSLVPNYSDSESEVEECIIQEFFDFMDNNTIDLGNSSSMERLDLEHKEKVRKGLIKKRVLVKKTPVRKIQKNSVKKSKEVVNKIPRPDQYFRKNSGFNVPKGPEELPAPSWLKNNNRFVVDQSVCVFWIILKSILKSFVVLYEKFSTNHRKSDGKSRVSSSTNQVW